MSEKLTYVVADLHGRLDLLEQASEAIRADAQETPVQVIFLGDYVDRGPDSKGVVDFLMNAQEAGSVTCLRGNHEQMMVDALGGSAPMDWWIDNGGDATLKSYEGSVPVEHLKWMADLPVICFDEHRVYVHAGVMPSCKLEYQEEEYCLWIREKFLRADASELPSHVVHGHTPRWAGKPRLAEPEMLPHRTNLDTGAYATGVLTIGVFDPEVAGGPIRVLTCEAA